MCKTDGKTDGKGYFDILNYYPGTMAPHRHFYLHVQCEIKY